MTAFYKKKLGFWDCIFWLFVIYAIPATFIAGPDILASSLARQRQLGYQFHGDSLAFARVLFCFAPLIGVGVATLLRIRKRPGYTQIIIGLLTYITAHSVASYLIMTVARYHP